MTGNKLDSPNLNIKLYLNYFSPPCFLKLIASDLNRARLISGNQWQKIKSTHPELTPVYKNRSRASKIVTKMPLSALKCRLVRKVTLNNKKRKLE